MRARILRTLGWFLAALVFASTFSGARASAATIVKPVSPFVAPVDAAGHLVPIEVRATGFLRNTAVFVEQCDGVSPTTTRWEPTEHCDLGGSPAAANADASGSVTFSPSDSAHAFVPFVGESPQQIFNCNSSAGKAPSNGLPNFTNCQLRVSSNNTIATADQMFIALTLPAGASNPPPSSSTTTTTPGTKAGSKTAITRAPGQTAKSGTKPSAKGAAAATEAGSSGSTSGSSGAGSSSGSGLLGLSDPGVVAGYALLGIGLAIAALSVRIARSRSSVRRSRP